MKTPANILVVDDDEDVLITAEVVLKQKFQSVTCINSPDQIESVMQKHDIDLVLLDMNYSPGDSTGLEGLKWLTWVRRYHPSVQVMMITAYGELALAVEAMKQGAVDFVTKPWQYAQIQEKVAAALALGETKEQVALIKKIKTGKVNQQRLGALIGSSVRMRKVKEMIAKVAPTDANVLLLGENGTGKEVVARRIYEMSKRKGKPFIHVDVGAITESLFESELFGHVKGAFTDAKSDKEGRFEAAHEGTIFLDEIGNLSLPMQSKLLNVLQRRVVVRVGEHKERSIDVRVIAATNAKLSEMVANGLFREDLLYRLNTLEIELPLLRERGDDLLLLVDHFLQNLGEEYDKPKLQLSDEALDELKDYHWPGNVRELQHTLERATIMADGSMIEADDLLMKSLGTKPKAIKTNNLEALEKQTIGDVIEQCDGNMSKVAKALGIGRTTLYRKIEKYGL